jgi:Ca-activated chloride channel homolog
VKRAAGFVFVTVFAGGLCGQPEPGAVDNFVLSSNVEMVLLDVSVKDRHGFVRNLSKEDFRVYENKKQQKLVSFSSQDTPVTVGLLIDHSGSVSVKRQEIITAALAFASQSNPEDEMFVVNFNDTARLGLPGGTSFTGDVQLLRQALVRYPMEGRTALNDALKLGFQQLDKGTRDKKTLILISDGGDNASFTSEEAIQKLALSSSATIYTIGIWDSQDEEKNPRLLKRLASITGGLYFNPEELSGLVAICQEIAKDIRNRYALAYEPSDRNYHGEIRKVKVVASAPGHEHLRLRTRTEYRANRSEAASHSHQHH